MNITKRYTNSYEVLKSIADKPIFIFGDFKDIRLKNHMSIAKFKRCFACSHPFVDDEGVYFGCVKGKGNVFFCKSCAEEYNTEGKT